MTALGRWSVLVADINGRRVMGSEGVRDPDFPCNVFRAGTPRGECETDGHYLCDECVERATCDGCGKRPTQCECPAPDRVAREFAPGWSR